MKCDDCRNAQAVITHQGTITYYLCLGCARIRVETMRRRMVALTRAIRKIETEIPETWLEFLKSRQTS